MISLAAKCYGAVTRHRILLLPPKRLAIFSHSFHSDATRRRPPLAFAFDIDGVLLRGATVVPAARRALEILNGNNVLETKIPHVLLTNGGGVSEIERSKKLSSQLGYQVHPSQVIQAHTVVKSIAGRYSNTPVLVLGGKLDAMRKVAEGYGLKQVYTTLDIQAWNPTVWPLHDLSPEERQSTKAVDFSTTPIAAVFVFHDPRNWALDIQILCDVLQSGGIVGGPYLSPRGTPVELVFCNPDLIWRSDFERPRLGQGAFKSAFQAIYKGLTCAEYPYIQYGKPSRPTYRFAEDVLAAQFQTLHSVNALPPVYMIGDNPESDIAGANAAGWTSVLVRTGVYDPAQGPPSHAPTHEAADVHEAVVWAMERELHKSSGS